MNDKLLRMIQKQINAELYSSYLYFSMSSWLERQNLKGFASWMRVQAKEEMFHATFMHDYLLRRGEQSLMAGVEQPPNEWEGIEDIFVQVAEHESKVTAGINDIATEAMDNRDHATYQFFMQYVDEQVEEEETAGDILGKIRHSLNKPEYIYALDTELGTRVYSQPFGTAADA